GVTEIEDVNDSVGVTEIEDVNDSVGVTEIEDVTEALDDETAARIVLALLAVTTFAVALFPSRPLVPSPHHITPRDDVNITQVWVHPVANCDTPVMTLVVGAVITSDVPPFPSCPRLPAPQHRTPDDAIIRAQVNAWPRETEATPLNTAGIGTLE